ncbi:MAG: flagellar basal body L-ring protein FlgH [Magnetococcales bacterium]|nr:flagellar basal body L-ring protein FlgH [Magnetococcales bacterium]NGZ25283.1 flagellar basal body L-ring protein FlgH [Magnetococcales bacterium]
MNRINWLLALTVGMTALSGCVMTRASERPPAPIAVIKPQTPEALSPKKGSIWQSTDRNTLFLDNKARNVGDLVTVVVSETSSAQKTASTGLSRDSSNDVDLDGLFGLSAAVTRANPGFTDSASIQGKHEFKGQGSTTRQGTFTATISCAVTEVLANGNLRIEGRRDITVNHENQFIILSGIIRPEDISPSNSVRSFQIADARIDYSGDGDIDDQQKPSWLNQLFSTLRIL